MFYKDDREWTDKAHKLAVEQIYKKVGWWCIDDIWHKNHLDDEDRRAGVDHIGLCKEEDDWFQDVGYCKNVYIQERFRKADKNNFNDFTLRYRRDNSRSDNQKDSEYYKLEKVLSDPSNERDYRMCYGTLNEKEDGFLKFAVLDLNKLYQHIEKGEIIVGQSDKYYSQIKDGKFWTGVSANKDGSSSFVSFDVKLLAQHFDDVVLYQEGFTGIEKSAYKENALAHKFNIENKDIDILTYYPNEQEGLWTYFVDVYDKERDKNIIAKLRVNENSKTVNIKIPEGIPGEELDKDLNYVKDNRSKIINYCQEKRYAIYQTIDEMENILNEIADNNIVRLTREEIMDKKLEMGTHYIIEDFGEIKTVCGEENRWEIYDTDGFLVETGTDFDKNISEMIKSPDYELEL